MSPEEFLHLYSQYWTPDPKEALDLAARLKVKGDPVVAMHEVDGACCVVLRSMLQEMQDAGFELLTPDYEPPAKDWKVEYDN